MPEDRFETLKQMIEERLLKVSGDVQISKMQSDFEDLGHCVNADVDVVLPNQVQIHLSYLQLNDGSLWQKVE